MSGDSSDQSNALKLIVDELITTTLTTGANIDHTPTNYVQNILDVFDYILSEASFSGQSLFVQSMKNFAYSLVEDDLCPLDNTEVLRTYSRGSFVLEGLKIRPMLLAGRRFTTSESQDYVQFPPQPLSTAQTVSVCVYCVTPAHTHTLH